MSAPIASPRDTIFYVVKVFNEFNCADTASVNVNAIEKPRVKAGPDKTIIEGGSTNLDGFVSGQAVSYVWSPASFMNDPRILDPQVTPPASIDYLITATSELGCGVAIDAVHVFVYKDIFVPTAFTPNGNNVNDRWYIPPLSAFKQFEISVFNRAGRVVFHAINANVPWDGNYNGVPQPSGVYVYLIEVKETGRILKGTVTLIR